MSITTEDMINAGIAKVTDPLFNFRVDDRAGGPLNEQAAQLGLLAELPGNWRGHGFNITARPFFGQPAGTPPFFLEINATSETLDFRAITGDIPNRGSVEPDMKIHGIHYLQQVTDVVVDAGIHIEPGIWLHVPAGAAADETENYVRQSTIPHGDSLLAQSTFFTTVASGPLINPVNSIPFTDATLTALNADPTNPITDPAYLAQYTNAVLPEVHFLKNLTGPDLVKDPTLLLKKQIEGQNIIETVVITISTADPGSLINIPFVKKNANATQLDAIFWIEKVQRPDGRVFMQIQYVQRVILDFIGIHWPHISVATLKRI